MQKTDERGPENGKYAVAYSFPDGTTRVAKLLDEEDGIKALLEIQRSGIDLLVEEIKFANDGLTYRSITSHGDEKCYESTTIEAKLKRFAPEFEEIFKSNGHLRNALPTHFAGLSKYLKL